MVSSKNVCFREKPGDKSPSPQPFREPEGMMSIDLNDKSSPEDSQNTSETETTISKKKYSCLKYVIILMIIKLFVLLSFVAALFLNSEYHLFHAEKPISLNSNMNITNSTTSAARREMTQLTMGGFKEHIGLKKYIEVNEEKLSLCKVTKSLEDCCEIFFNTELFDVAELCTVNDILDILLDFEINVEKRKKRQINVPFQKIQQQIAPYAGYASEYINPIYQMPSRIKSELPNIYGTVRRIMNPRPRGRANQDDDTNPNFPPFDYSDYDSKIEYFDHEHFDPRSNHPSYWTPENIHSQQQQQQQQQQPQQEQQQSYYPAVPAEHKAPLSTLPNPVEFHVIYPNPNQKSVHPVDDTEYVGAVDGNAVKLKPKSYQRINDKKIQNSEQEKLDINKFVNEPKYLNGRSNEERSEQIFIPENRLIEIRPTTVVLAPESASAPTPASPVIDLPNPQTITSIMKNLTPEIMSIETSTTIGTRTSTTNEHRVKLKNCTASACSKNIATDVKIAELVNLHAQNQTIELDLDNTTIHLSKTFVNSKTTDKPKKNKTENSNYEKTSKGYKVDAIERANHESDFNKNTEANPFTIRNGNMELNQKSTITTINLSNVSNSDEPAKGTIVYFTTTTEKSKEKATETSKELERTRQEISYGLINKVDLHSNQQPINTTTPLSKTSNTDDPAKNTFENSKTTETSKAEATESSNLDKTSGNEKNSVERANQEIDFGQKNKPDQFPVTNLQSNQQTMVNPCLYSYPTPFGSPYKMSTAYDGSQLLKIVNMNSPKLQQPTYVVNPPMYSYIPPQAPYIQSFAAPVQQHYNNPIQVSGPGGQYYMCNPIPAPTNSIAGLAGVEVRSSLNLDDVLDGDTNQSLKSNLTRESLLDCPSSDRSCEDGSKCIKKQQVCDNEIDCDDGSDEKLCSCRERVGKIRQCDGYFDCANGEDEQGCFGCDVNEFSCDDWSRFRRSTCIPMEQRCDNIRQCEITGKDEEDCSVLTDAVGNISQYKISNAVGFLHRNYKGKWYPTCFGTELWAIDVCKTEAGPSNINPRSHMMLTSNSYNGDFINILPNNEVSLVNTCVQDRAAFVECPPLYCGLRMIVKNPYRHQEVETSAEDTFNNYERSNYEESFEVVNLDSKNVSNILGISRVVGGKPSQPAAWPWIVSIYKNGIFHCGGVLINEWWVVTAAHCIDRYWQYYYEVQAGMLRRFSYSPMEQNRWTAEAIPHEDYDKANLKNDIALLRLSSPVRYNRYVRPICLPSETTAGRDFLRGPPPGTICTTVGWGATIEHGADPDNMREVEIPILTNCKHQEDRDGEDICAGLSDGGKDACQGDSGGPFMCRNPNNPSQWYLAGIVSHGEGCARPNEPGVYTRVSKYVGWIAENIRDDKFTSRIPLQRCPGFTCKGTERCLPKKRRCDKIVDCLMGDDEAHCENVFHDIFKNAMTNRLLGAAKLGKDKGGNNLISGLLDELLPQSFNPADEPVETTTQFEEFTTEITAEEIATTLHSKTDVTSKNSHVDGTNNQINATYSSDITTETVTSESKPASKQLEDNEVEYFKCEKMLQLIPISKRCNTVVDCEDGTDELDCLCADYIKNYNPRAICDGITDCSDLSDENDCVKCNYLTEYYCRMSQKCIDLSRRCDGTSDCDRSEDEWDCAALTNGATLTLDSDLRPKLGMSGIITINRFGVWRPLCANMSDNEASIATNVCNLLGFEEYISYHKYPVKDKPLNVTIDGFKYDDGTNETTENGYVCGGMYLRCSNVSLDSSVHNVHQDNITGSDVELYTSPWNAVIYSDGIYRCMGTILDTRWIVTSINCFKDITMLQLHYVVALLGKGKTELLVEGPHEQTLRVVETIQINSSDVVLLRLEKNIIYTRYVRPTHLNARRESLHREKCIAIGLEGDSAKYVFLIPLKNCPDGLRCFESKIRKQCKKTPAWTGTIVCDSRNGWYVAAVFHEPKGSCGLSQIKQYTSVKFLKNEIFEAMKQEAFVVDPSKCAGLRCKLGECIAKKRICDGIPHCRSGEDEEASLCYGKEMECHLTDNCVCPLTHMKCSNNKCVPKNAFCDRKNDCGDFGDEPDVCSCRAYLQLTNTSKICDGVVNCMDRSDEDPQLCHCGLEDFKCSQSEKCIPHEMVCDGFVDCPQDEDESVCISLKAESNNRPNIGEVMTRTAGKWHTGCFKQYYTTSELEEICFKLGFTSGGAYQMTPHRDVTNLTAQRPVIDQFDIVWIHRRPGNRFKLRMRTGNEPYVTFYPDQDCHRLFVECV